MNIYIIGSVTTSGIPIECAADKFEELEHEVRYVKPEDKPLNDLIRASFELIETWADMVVVVPKSVYPTIEIGEGTLYEMEHAKSLDKLVVIYYDL